MSLLVNGIAVLTLVVLYYLLPTLLHLLFLLHQNLHLVLPVFCHCAPYHLQCLVVCLLVQQLSIIRQLMVVSLNCIQKCNIGNKLVFINLWLLLRHLVQLGAKQVLHFGQIVLILLKHLVIHLLTLLSTELVIWYLVAVQAEVSSLPYHILLLLCVVCLHYYL